MTADSTSIGLGHGVSPTLRVQRGRLERPVDVPPAWTRHERGARYDSRLSLYRHRQGWLLDIACEGRGRLLIGEDAITIDWQGGTPADHYLRTVGLALWLELHGVLCLHANALVCNGTAIGLIAPSQTGKTTLSAAFVDAGWTLFTDDMTALHRDGDAHLLHASAAELRLWPDSGRHFGGDRFIEFAPVHQRFAKRVVPLRRAATATQDAVPLRRLYLLERDDDGNAAIRFEPLGAAAALLVLMQHSMLGDAGAALGIEAARLAKLATLLDRVAMIRVHYPSGLDALTQVQAKIEQELRASLAT